MRRSLALLLLAALPALAAAQARRVAAVGDPGTRGRGQRAVAAAMAAEHARAPFAAVLLLGDNVYEDGEPKWFDAALREPYAPLRAGGARFLPVLGNHDVRAGGGDAQRAFWGAARWYKTTIGPAELFAIDTTILLPENQKGAYDGRLPEIRRLAVEQLDWLDEELARSKARHRIVFGHHPLYVSTGERGKVAEAARLRARLEPILRKRRVKLYLAGHEHHYERSEPVGGVVHVISGAGGKLAWWPSLYGSGVAAKIVRRRHFLVLDFPREALRVRALGKDGRFLDEFSIP